MIKTKKLLLSLLFCVGQKALCVESARNGYVQLRLDTQPTMAHYHKLGTQMKEQGLPDMEDTNQDFHITLCYENCPAIGEFQGALQEVKDAIPGNEDRISFPKKPYNLFGRFVVAGLGPSSPAVDDIYSEIKTLQEEKQKAKSKDEADEIQKEIQRKWDEKNYIKNKIEYLFGMVSNPHISLGEMVTFLNNSQKNQLQSQLQNIDAQEKSVSLKGAVVMT